MSNQIYVPNILIGQISLEKRHSTSTIITVYMSHNKTLPNDDNSMSSALRILTLEE